MARSSRQAAKAEVVDGDAFGCERALGAVAGRQIGTFAVNLNSGEQRWNLFDFTYKLSGNCFGQLLSDVLVGKKAVDGLLQVVAWCGCTNHHGATILFYAGLELLNLFSGRAHANKHEARCQRVESAGMAYLHFLHPERAPKMPFQLVDNLEGCPLNRLVDRYDGTGGHKN